MPGLQFPRIDAMLNEKASGDGKQSDQQGKYQKKNKHFTGIELYVGGVFLVVIQG